MDRSRPIVIRGPGVAPPVGPPTPGMDRRELLDHDDRWLGWVKTDPGVAGGWHHHGDRDSYVYVLRGRVIVEFGSRGRERMTGSAGDLIFNPHRMVHREITGADGPAELLVVRIGTGPLNVNVDGPEADPYQDQPGR